MSRSVSAGIVIFCLENTCAMLSGYVAVFSFSYVSTASGPMSRLSCTVCRMPPPFECVLETVSVPLTDAIECMNAPALRSRMLFVPRRGWMEKKRSPAMRATSSANTPAALMMSVGCSVPRLVCTAVIFPFSTSMPSTAVLSAMRAPFCTAFSA